MTRAPRSPSIFPNTLLDFISPEPHAGSLAAAPVQPELVSKSAVSAGGLVPLLDIVNDGWLKML